MGERMKRRGGGARKREKDDERKRGMRYKRRCNEEETSESEGGRVGMKEGVRSEESGGGTQWQAGVGEARS